MRAATATDISQPQDLDLWVRVSPHSYFTALLLGTFLSAFLFYLEVDIAGVAFFAIAWIVVPALALRDGIRFDGRRLERTGLIPRIWSRIYSSRRRLRLQDIEQVETHAVRAAKRGGNIYYRYRSIIRGKGLTVVIASGGEAYRQILGELLQKLHEDVLDLRSIELRDHLADPKETLTRAEFARIPSAEVLRGLFRRPVKKDRLLIPPAVDTDAAKADELRSLGNALRVSGYLCQAVEALRRAVNIAPKDPRLLLDLGRCLDSLAGAERDRLLKRKALALLRLAGRRAGDDGDLLVRLGETYTQLGDHTRAADAFSDAMAAIGKSFRGARGLAEIALHEGKIAHVIHNFSSAREVAHTPALRRWAAREEDYFSRLHQDEEYMDLEISRVNLLETVERSKRTSLILVFIALPAILLGVLAEESLIANVGWAIASVSLVVWTGLIVTSRLLGQRIPYDLVETDEQ